jgi:hypothetical protein
MSAIALMILAVTCGAITGYALGSILRAWRDTDTDWHIMP